MLRITNEKYFYDDDELEDLNSVRDVVKHLYSRKYIQRVIVETEDINRILGLSILHMPDKNVPYTVSGNFSLPEEHFVKNDTNDNRYIVKNTL